MINTTLRTLAVLLLWQLASCASSESQVATGDAGYRSSAASDYADAILAGMERARVMREMRLQSAVVP
jgi:hypothetical protein